MACQDCCCCCKKKAGVCEKLHQYISSQVRRKAKKAYKLKALEEAALNDERDTTSKLIDATLQCKNFIKEKFPDFEKTISIQYLSPHYRSEAWSAYFEAKRKCEDAIKDEINRIMAASASGKTYDEVVEMVKTLKFNVEEDE